MTGGHEFGTKKSLFSSTWPLNDLQKYINSHLLTPTLWPTRVPPPLFRRVLFLRPLAALPPAACRLSLLLKRSSRSHERNLSSDPRRASRRHVCVLCLRPHHEVMAWHVPSAPQD